jgi:predicted anti-sigma-YlaC factor YlaD
MTHLTDVELVDLLDGALPSPRERHLDECDGCRAIATRMRAAFALAKDVEMPEPSPLFWEHFSARVHEGVRGAEASQTARWFGWAQGATAKWAMSAALLTLLVVAGVWRATAPAPRKAASTVTVAAGADVAANEDPFGLGAFDAETDEAWALVRTVADDVTWDDAAAEGLDVHPGSVEHAMATLTGDERSELVRLLEAETKKRGA